MSTRLLESTYPSIRSTESDANAICLPSGDHLGTRWRKTLNSPAGVVDRAARAPPESVLAKMSSPELVSPTTVLSAAESKAMRVPSGDHAGQSLAPLPCAPAAD